MPNLHGWFWWGSFHGFRFGVLGVRIRIVISGLGVVGFRA